MPVTVTIECVIGGTPVVKGTADPVTGLSNGSTTVTISAFASTRVFVLRGMFHLPGINPGGGSDYYQKVLADDYLTLNSPLVNGEIIYIKTIN